MRSPPRMRGYRPPRCERPRRCSAAAAAHRSSRNGRRCRRLATTAPAVSSVALDPPRSPAIAQDHRGGGMRRTCPAAVAPSCDEVHRHGGIRRIRGRRVYRVRPATSAAAGAGSRLVCPAPSDRGRCRRPATAAARPLPLPGHCRCPATARPLPRLRTAPAGARCFPSHSIHPGAPRSRKTTVVVACVALPGRRGGVVRRSAP
jgi:hypothetical protein